MLQGGQSTEINSVDSWGRSPIHAAAITAGSKCLLVLIQNGADVNAKCGPRGEYKTALHLSAEHGHLSNVQCLLETGGSSYLLKDVNGLTALDIAERAGHQDCMELLRKCAGT